MHKFKFNFTVEDVDAHIRNSLSEEDRKQFENARFVPVHVNYNEDMNIEITAVAALVSDEEEE